MIRINLLPFRGMHAQENARRMVFVFLLFLLGTLLFIFALGRHLEAEIKEKQSLLTESRKSAASLEVQSKKLEVLRSELEAIETKMKTLGDFERERRRPVEIFEALTEAIIPQRIWLSEYRTEENRIRMTGFSLDDKAIADFMTHLEKTGLFTSVNLDGVQQKVQGQIHLRSFTLSCLEEGK